MVGIIGVGEGVGEHQFRLVAAELEHHFMNGFFGGLEGIVSGIEKTNLRAENVGGFLGLGAP
jgi:hypothetical protein